MFPTFSSRATVARLVLLLLFSLTPALLAAQNDPAISRPAEPEAVHRPRIGVALSGGGALGLAHIGVLEWMEQNHIPIDRIAGTSMGGIVGAIYATGMSAAEMHAYTVKIDWTELLRTGPTYRDLVYRRKQDRRDYRLAEELGLRHGLSGPNGLNPGQGIELFLDRIALPYSSISSFDDLPTPFRCVATDMISGDEVILKSGSLSRALRAGMAIPGVFTPVEFDGKVLADGGLVDNLPTGIARDMGANVVIGIDLGTQPVASTELQSLTGMLSRAVSIMITANERRSMKLADELILLDTAKFSISDYSQAEQLIKLGYDGAAAKGPELKRYAVSDAAWRQYLDERAARKLPRPARVELVEVDGTSQKHVARKIENSLRGPFDPEKVDRTLNAVTADGQFDRLGYEGFVQNGVPGLRVIAHEKAYAPPFLDLSVDVQGSGVADFDFAAGARVTFTNVEHHGGEWRNDLLLGSSNLAATEFYQPITGTDFFVAPYAFVSKQPRNEFNGQIRVAVFGDERGGGGFDLGYSFGRRGELRFGYQIFSGRLAPLIGSAGLPTLSGSTGEFRTRYVWDNQDNPAVPRSGLRLVATASRVLQSPGLAHPLDQLDVESSIFIPMGAKTSLFLLADGGTTFHGSATPFQVFPLGGPFRLGAYLPYEFVGNHYGYASIGFHREFYTLPQLAGGRVYWGGWYEAGTAFNSMNSVEIRGSANAGIIADTIVGPIAIFGSVSPTGLSRLNLSIGRQF